MALYLVRHAKAGSRSAWTGSDYDRPLSAEGRAQALAIGGEWAHGTPAAVLSSPRLRCRETVQPLADRFGLPLQVENLLDEDTPFEKVLALLEDSPDDTVFCSHGDVIPAVMDALVRRGLTITGSRGALRKAAMFVVHREGGRFARAELVDPPTD
jgi:8-oxo-dGTP diphosphatase